jgi:hypothetical protein
MADIFEAMKFGKKKKLSSSIRGFDTEIWFFYFQGIESRQSLVIADRSQL